VLKATITTRVGCGVMGVLRHCSGGMKVPKQIGKIYLIIEYLLPPVQTENDINFENIFECRIYGPLAATCSFAVLQSL